MNPEFSQLSPHRAERVVLPGRYGPVAALRAHVSPGAPIVLMVPGYTGSKEDFVPLLDGIADAGIEAVAIDLPGQYESPGPDDPDAYLPAALGVFVAELAGKLAADGRPVLLFGHSYGGLVSRGALLAGAPVRGLTLLGSGPGQLPAGPFRQGLEAGRQILQAGRFEAALELWHSIQVPDRPAEVTRLLRERLRRSSPIGLLGMANGVLFEPDLVDLLGRALRLADAGCLVACGEYDHGWPVATQRDMADRLDADFAVIPAARHAPNTENPIALLKTLLPTWRTWLSAPPEQH
jgi:pimeloyl-ACP methyl ester carboxylesterase